MAEILKDENPRKDLYRMLLADKTPGVADKIKKYSFNQFEKHLLSNEDAQNELGWYLEKKGVVSDPADFSQRYIQEPIAPPTPKPQPVPVAPSPVAIEEEEELYIPEPPPAIGSSEYDAQLQAQYGGMSPTLGATFGGVPAAFETKAQKKQEQISPAFKAQQLAFEDVPIAEEQRRAQRQFAKATKEQQQAALMGSPGFEVEQKKRKKERGYGEWGEDVVGSWVEGGKRIGKNILSTVGYFAQTQAATDPMANLPYEKRQEMMQQASQTMYDNATAAQNTFQNEIAKRNIQTSVLQAINKGEYSRLPESVLYTVGDAAMQIIPSILTFGGSTYAQTLPQVYKDGVDAIAKEKGISPEQAIANGDDAFVVSQINAGVQSALEYAGAGLVSKGIASKGGYKAMRDWLLGQNVNRRLAQGAALLGVGTGEAATEYGQELTGQIGKTAAKSSTTKAFLDKLPNEIFTPEARNQRAEAFVGGLVGGLGLTGAGQAIQSAMDRTLFEAPKIGKATQRADYDVVQTDNKIQQRNKIAQAMEEAVKANPEAEGQIRQQYQKLINEAAPTDEEVLSAYESLSVLPETEEKNAIRENLEGYMAEKGIQAEPTGMDAGLGELMRREPPVIQTVNAEFPAPIAEEEVTEEVPAEETLTPEEEDEDLAAFGRELEAIEQAAPVAPAEEEVVTEKVPSEEQKQEATNEQFDNLVNNRENINYESVVFDETAEGKKRKVSGVSDIIDYAGRKIVIININGRNIPFYLSTGRGGKADVTSGKWYPIFGIGKDGWLNKLSGKEINDYYGSPILRGIAESLDRNIGDIRNDESIPKVGATGSHIAAINKDLNPTENEKANTRDVINQNIKETIDFLDRQFAPTEEVVAPEAAPEVVAAAPVEEVAPEAPIATTTDSKGRVSRFFKKEETKSDGTKVTTFQFERSDKGGERFTAVTGVPVNEVIGDQWQINENDIPPGEKPTKIVELREANDGRVAATVVFENEEELTSQGEVTLTPKPKPEAPAAPAPKGRKKAAPVTPAPAAPKKEEAPKPEPTAKKIDKKSVQASLDKAKEEYEKARSAFDKKRSELDKTTREDVKNLFGERKVEMKAKGLFEMPRISPEQRERAIQPFRDRMNKAKEEVNRLTKMLEEGEEAAKELTFEKEKEYEKVQGTGKKAREGKGAPKTERAVRPKAKPVRNAGKTPDAIAARNITFYSDPIATSLQYLMDATYHPDLLESIFGGPSRTTKSGRKDISGERKARIQFLDKTSNIKSADRLGEYLAERYAEENNIDVKDAEEQHDFASIATDIISSYSSRNQMVRELLRLNEQQNDEFEFMYNPEAIYGEGYNEDIAKEIDNILDELPDSYWEEREITDEEYGNLFAEEVEPETKEGKKAEAKKEKGRTPEEPTKKGVRFEKGKKLTEEEKKEVYKNLKDSYKEMKRPYTIETRVSQYTGRDYEARVWLENASDYMQTSDVTGRKLRYYIFLPDGTLAHPTEIFPNISPSEMTRVQRNVEYNERQANEKMDDITSQLKKSGEINKVVKAIETALNNGAEFVKEYDSGDVGQKNPLVMLRFPNGRKWGVPQYVINTQDSILGFTQKDVVKYNLGESREKIFDTNYQPDWEQFYNNNKQAKAQPSAPSFTSQQSSEAATAFDKAKTSKGFDKKYGKGAYKALSDITKNFDEIMDKVSDKIKQDCL